MMIWCLKPECESDVVDARIELESVICPAYSEHQRAARRSSPLALLQNPSAAAFSWTHMGELLVRPEVYSELIRSGFTGFTSRSVMRVDGKIPCSQLELVISGWGGYASPDSGVRLTKSCDSCGLRIYSCFQDSTRLFEPNQWDGSDLFVIWPMPRFVMATERFRMFVIENGLGGVGFTPIEELTCSGTLTPGNIRDWFPDRNHDPIGA